ncbi:MAG: ribosome small subunit-dependent GTPase A [Planctomycetota bacterium]|jgi:ribosome biogenesis GTPase|nr:MAG: ribosome small subunit-dependent GTPase A [Planctomycetota bacterium]
MAKPRKQRVEFRKNRSTRRRDGDLTRTLGDDPDAAADRATSERISGKGDLTRKRTVVAHDVDADIDGLRVAAGETAWRGRVLNVHGLESHVQADDGRIVRCTMRRLLRTIATDQRHPLAAGDWVRIRDVGDEGTIQSIEPRHQSLSRDSRGRRHVIVANVDQMIIVGSAAQPDLKPGLIDRLIVAAESAGIRPLICLNKVDLVDPSALVPLAGVFARMGYPVVLCSTVTGMGVARLQAELRGRVTAVVGQSGVGKSSLLNVLDPDLDLRVAEVSRENEKGRHTTTTARLLPHRFNGWFVDTPGVRQFQPWQLVPAEVPSAFRDLRPIANLCRFPNCTHDHETGCAVKDAVADGLLDVRRWESCRQLAVGDEPREEDE